MAYNGFEILLFSVLGLLSVAGGVPQIFRWIKPKPHLKIVNVSISKQPDDKYKNQIHLEVENEARFWTRNGDASNVTLEYFMIDRNGVQCAYAPRELVCAYLLVGTKIQKDTEGYHVLMPEGNPYSVIFRVTCNEGGIVKQTVNYEAASIIR